MSKIIITSTQKDGGGQNTQSSVWPLQNNLPLSLRDFSLEEALI